MKKYLFLDIDGVLNREHECHANGFHGTDPDCVARLNRIISATDPEIVISSSWRREIHRGHMNLLGFEILLLSHGINCECRLAGITRPDVICPTRGDLITLWLHENARPRDPYVILDDGSWWKPEYQDHGIRTAGHSKFFVQTNPRTGLTDHDVRTAIKILNRRQFQTDLLKLL